MPTLPKVDVVFVGFGMVGGIIANELSKQAMSGSLALYQLTWLLFLSLPA